MSDFSGEQAIQTLLKHDACYLYGVPGNTEILAYEPLLRLREEGLYFSQSDEFYPCEGLALLKDLAQKSTIEKKNYWWMGISSYDFAWQCFNRKNPHEALGPDFDWVFYRFVLVRDKHKKCLQFEQAFDIDRTKITIHRKKADDWKPKLFSEQRQDFTEQVKAIQDEIRKGSFYQINLSRKITGTFDPKNLSRILRQSRSLNPSGMNVICRRKDEWLISTSPERLLKKTAHKLLSEPIKGTSPRYRSVLKNSLSKKNLKHSKKNLAELAMIVDMCRNDFFQGYEALDVHNPKVEVKRFPRLQSYKNVHHLNAEIHAESDEPFYYWFNQLFPGASITGSPKLAAMEAIARYEAESRFAYTGSFAYFNGSGEGDSNILIRTALLKGDAFCFRTGGGITLLSKAEDEYQETVHKARTLEKIFLKKAKK